MGDASDNSGDMFVVIVVVVIVVVVVLVVVVVVAVVVTVIVICLHHQCMHNVDQRRHRYVTVLQDKKYI